MSGSLDFVSKIEYRIWNYVWKEKEIKMNDDLVHFFKRLVMLHTSYLIPNSLVFQSIRFLSIIDFPFMD